MGIAPFLKTAALLGISAFLSACALEPTPKEIESGVVPGLVDCSKGNNLSTVPSCRAIVREAIRQSGR